MSYSINASGHVPSGTEDQPPSAIEAELAVKLHEVFADPKYGCSTATFYGQHIGQVDLNATATPGVGDEGGHTQADADSDGAEQPEGD